MVRTDDVNSVISMLQHPYVFAYYNNKTNAQVYLFSLLRSDFDILRRNNFNVSFFRYNSKNTQRTLFMYFDKSFLNGEDYSEVSNHVNGLIDRFHSLGLFSERPIMNYVPSRRDGQTTGIKVFINFRIESVSHFTIECIKRYLTVPFHDKLIYCNYYIENYTSKKSIA
jgi:hypothetical protein